MVLLRRIAGLALVCLLAGCGAKQSQETTISDLQTSQVVASSISEKEISLVQQQNVIDPDGVTLEDRIKPPAGYIRVPSEEDSFTAFIRNYELKPAESPVLLYDGREKGNQQAHEAVFTMHIEPEDFQQCADSVMRIYAEYLYGKGDYNKIKFHLVSGFPFDFGTWSQGNKMVINNDKAAWAKNTSNDTSLASFERYLHILFAYASTLSMSEESAPIDLPNLQVGDIFIKGGSPGHVVMVADMAQNEAGEKAFLLAQGYMPAQEFHILKNPEHPENPWYYVSETEYPFRTPEYTFQEGSLKRPPYLAE